MDASLMERITLSAYQVSVQESGWPPDRYEAWLSETLLKALAS